jgi:hypothetical protein
MKCATLQGRDIKRLMKVNQQMKKKYEVYMIRENPKLYEIAKQISLEHGFDYHHPLLGITTKAPSKGSPVKPAKAEPRVAKSAKQKARSKREPQSKPAKT